MLIREIPNEDNLKLLAHMHLGRLACAQGGQPYVVPFYFAYQDSWLYSFSTVGQKIDWMRANPLVCVQTDEVVSAEEWVSIVISGRYEELPDVPGFRIERELAYKLLQQKANWWEPGYAKTIIRRAQRPMDPVYFRIQIAQVTGHLSASDSESEIGVRSLRGERADTKPINGLLESLRKMMFPR
jgi:nitroimidazol reductase NimA-like FMN-containing flavoprotein (pyridoxamine 5'-phosphate oxidase superfamily)